MTDDEFLSLVKDRSTSGVYLFDPDGTRALWVGHGHAEEAVMDLPLDRTHVEPMYLERFDLLRTICQATGGGEPATR